MDQPRISQANTWERYKKDIFLLIDEVLSILQQQPNLPEIEDSQQWAQLITELESYSENATRQEIMLKKPPQYWLP